ncbi:MAG TPA: S53 family peptidase [Pseudonocardiaceae bacterium]|nr:S53 family peptidase [Pseudonocardiaceae bacterium]
MAAALPAAAADGPSAIPQSHPQWATPQSKVADVAASSSITFRVYLKTRNEAGAESLAQAVSDPTSAAYGRYLSPAQVKTQFAPTQSQVDSVRGWLNSSGFGIDSVPSNNAFVEATGSAAQVDRAFNVHLGTYRVAGQTLRAPDTNLSIPSQLNSVVLGTIGVDQSESLLKPNLIGGPSDVGTTSATARANAVNNQVTPGVVPPPAGFRNAQPCSQFFGQKIDTTDPTFNGKQLPYAPCGYNPSQLRGAYGIDKTVAAGIDGRGVTVAIVDAFGSPNLFADAVQYAKRNDPAHPLLASQFTEQVAPPTPGQEDPSQCDAAGWYGEQSLDVEAVHAMAPGAHILYVGGADCQNLSLDESLNSIVAAHSANMVSNSYGNQGEDLTASDIQAFNQIAVQAVLEGIGVYFSSGDSGDEAANVGRPETDFSADDPWVTAVGGTSLGINQNNKVIVQTGWEIGRGTLVNGAWTAPKFQSGSGGGTSRVFPEPFYQKGVVPDALAAANQTGSNRGRVVPDISMLADPNTGFLMVMTQTFPEGVFYDQFRIGGTSLSSPLMAGLMADSDQFTHFHHGFINPMIYRVTAHTPAISDVLPQTAAVARVDFVNGTDATGGTITSVRMFNDPDQTIHTAKGYDNVTGVGTPRGLLFLALS